MSRPVTVRALSVTSAAALGAALTLAPAAGAMADEVPATPAAAAAPATPAAQPAQGQAAPSAPERVASTPETPAAPSSATQSGASSASPSQPVAEVAPEGSDLAGGAPSAGAEVSSGAEPGVQGDAVDSPAAEEGRDPSVGESASDAPASEVPAAGGPAASGAASFVPSGGDASSSSTPTGGTVTAGATSASASPTDSAAGADPALTAIPSAAAPAAEAPAAEAAATGEPEVASDPFLTLSPVALRAVVPSDGTQPPAESSATGPGTASLRKAGEAESAASIDPALREEYLQDLKERFPGSDPKHVASLSDDDLVTLAIIDDAMTRIQTKEEAVSFFLSDDALTFFDLLFGTETTDRYAAAIDAYLTHGSKAELAAWYRKTFGVDAAAAKDFATSVAAALDAESGVDEPSVTPTTPTKPVAVTKPTKPTAPAKPTKPTSVAKPTAPAKPVVHAQPAAAPSSKATQVAAAAQPAATPDLAQTGFEGFGAAGLGVLALLAGGLATIVSRRVRLSA
jgi:hypothetical protein